jgi:2-polyprenyl-6-hydroxyphenyl methylase / 3-demethylubiquinone-9 3-methyltransferase
MTTNYDAAELAKFSALAHRWWDPTSEFRPLHDINPLRLAHIDRLAGGLAGKRVLDVGCGGGILAEAMAAKGAQVTGIDLADRALKVAQLHGIEVGSGVDYRLISAEDLAAEAPESFDVVTCMEMLEHVPQPPSVVAACARLARPGGHVFFSTINRNPKSFLFAIVGAELARDCRAAGLAVEDLTGMTYNPISKRYALGRDVDVNYLLACRK